MGTWAWSAGEADGGEVGQVGDWSGGPPRHMCGVGGHESERGSECGQMTDSRAGGQALSLVSALHLYVFPGTRQRTDP